MSQAHSSADSSQNSEFFRRLASKLLHASPAQQDTINRPEDLINLIIEEKFREYQLPAGHLKTESEVQLNIGPEQSQISKPSKDDLWIFGYGSLVWKADFPFVARRTGYIRGYERKFYQNSIDHRGTAEQPGRVVTLIPSSDPHSRVWGIAYQIAAAEKEKVLKHLDFREKNGYERHSVLFYPYNPQKGATNDRIQVVIYVASDRNDSFAGHIDDLQAIADQVYAAAGPSGTNREYVFKLANAMRQLFPGEKDDHLFELEQKLRDRETYDRKLNENLKSELFSMLDMADKGQDNNLDHLERSIRNKFEEFRKNFQKTSSTS